MSHRNLPKHLQIISEPIVQNLFQPYINSQLINTQNETYAGKAKKNLSKKETTAVEFQHYKNCPNNFL